PKGLCNPSSNASNAIVFSNSSKNSVYTSHNPIALKVLVRSRYKQAQIKNDIRFLHHVEPVPLEQIPKPLRFDYSESTQSTVAVVNGKIVEDWYREFPDPNRSPSPSPPPPG